MTLIGDIGSDNELVGNIGDGDGRTSRYSDGSHDEQSSSGGWFSIIFRVVFTFIKQSVNLIYGLLITTPITWIVVTFTTFHRLIFSWITFLAVLWSSAFLYAVVYYLYIPMVAHSKIAHFQFDARCDLSSQCEIPFADIPLVSSRSSVYFAKGQPYKFRLHLELPESEINWNQGMFMVRLKMFDGQKKQVINVAKPAILNFKSPLLRLFCTLFYWPLLVLGMMSETQTASILLLEDFIEGSYPDVGYVTDARIEIEARQLQIIPPSYLIIQAHLQGLRYYMFHWPITSALIGTFSICMFLTVLVLLSFHHSSSRSDADSQTNDDDNDDMNDETTLSLPSTITANTNEGDNRNSMTTNSEQFDSGVGMASLSAPTNLRRRDLTGIRESQDEQSPKIDSSSVGLDAFDEI